MALKKKRNSIVMSTMAGSIAISSPLAFTLPVDAMTKEQFEEIHKLTYGEHHEAVVQLQQKLKTLNFYQGNYTPKYDALTEHALRHFQKQHNINPTGETDEATYLKLEEELDAHHKEIIETFGNQIKYGEQSNRVRQVQKALNHYGFYKHKIDSIAGPKTKKALERMSKAYHLDLDLSDLTPIVQVTQSKPKTQTQRTEQPEQSQSNVQQAVKTEPQAKAEPKASTGTLIQTARTYIGSPYVWGGTSPSGFDCSGYLQYVFKQHGINIPRTVDAIYYSGQSVEKPSVGDLVFFETYKPGPSHAGIYIGDGKFIHAGLSNGVTISQLSNSYWSARYLGAKRIAK